MCRKRGYNSIDADQTLKKRQTIITYINTLYESKTKQTCMQTKYSYKCVKQCCHQNINGEFTFFVFKDINLNYLVDI